MQPRKKNAGHPLLHTVEEATELLRRCGVEAWAWWFAGSVPFAIGLLHFINDMGHAATAGTRLPGSALVLALLYWWMKIAQAVFSDGLLRRLQGDDSPAPLPWRGRLRFITSQGLIHCTAPWMLVLSFAAMLPFGWAYAAYHNVSILAMGVFRRGGRTRDLVHEAVMQSKYRQGQNHGILIVLMAFAAIVWLNWQFGIRLAAVVASMITGSENAVSRNPLMLLSTGVIAATATATYIVVGPFVKALYVLRCFYSLSRRNGEDLEMAFRASGGLRSPVWVLALCLAWPAMGGTTPSPSDSKLSAPQVSTSAPSAASRSIDPGQLGQQIHEVIQEDIFQWRLPRDAHEEKAGWIDGFANDLRRWYKQTSDAVGNTFERWMKYLFKDWIKPKGHELDANDLRHPASSWTDNLYLILKALLVILSVALVALLVRQWRQLPPPPARADTAPEVNLESDQVVATQLPENEWLRLAEEKISAGELRLAMRALFLATLAHLGERKLLGIGRSKSNGDYVRELSLRARDRNELRGRFSDSVHAFDRAWYGWHEVTRELLEQFRDNHQHIISDGHAR
ncbi:MAG: hypothetical protein JWO94_2699 [Verrucomicrobiaceae bacterium]|nr:hypothetical protein [Verrucomicrobiaceae bacterium]